MKLTKAAQSGLVLLFVGIFVGIVLGMFIPQQQQQMAVATKEPTMQLTQPVPSPSSTPNIVSPTPTSCESLQKIIVDNDVQGIIIHLTSGGPVHQAPNGTKIPKGSIFWTTQVQVEVSTELAEIIKADRYGMILRTLQEVTFQISGNYVDDPCGK